MEDANSNTKAAPLEYGDKVIFYKINLTEAANFFTIRQYVVNLKCASSFLYSQKYIAVASDINK